MASIRCRRCKWIQQGHHKIYVSHRCEHKLSRRSMLMIVGLLLVMLEAGLLSSNALALFGWRTDKSLNFGMDQAGTSASVPRPDPSVKEIDALLKRFEIDGTRRERVAEAIVQSSRKHNIEPRLIASIVIVESRGNPFAISSANAVGVMQIHVPTWARTVDREGINLFKIEDNVDFGVRILKDYVRRYGQDEGIKRYNGWVPNSSESGSAEAYLQKVRRVYRSRT